MKRIGWAEGERSGMDRPGVEGSGQAEEDGWNGEWNVANGNG